MAWHVQCNDCDSPRDQVCNDLPALCRACLIAENDKLREALERIEDYSTDWTKTSDWNLLVSVQETARQALKGADDETE